MEAPNYQQMIRERLTQLKEMQERLRELQDATRRQEAEIHAQAGRIAELRDLEKARAEMERLAAKAAEKARQEDALPADDYEPEAGK